MDELLKVIGVTKYFKRRCVLDDVSFSVRRSEVLGLIGPNGAGKTTLFECLAGLMTADAGTMRSGHKVLPASHGKAMLFYLPDAILPGLSRPLAGLCTFLKSSTNQQRSPCPI